MRVGPRPSVLYAAAPKTANSAVARAAVLGSSSVPIQDYRMSIIHGRRASRRASARNVALTIPGDSRVVLSAVLGTIIVEVRETQSSSTHGPRASRPAQAMLQVISCSIVLTCRLFGKRGEMSKQRWQPARVVYYTNDPTAEFSRTTAPGDTIVIVPKGMPQWPQGNQPNTAIS